MTAKEYYNSQSLTDANRLIVDKNKVNYSRSDLIRFAESYASQQTEKYRELILEQDKLIKLQESSQYFEVIEAKEVRREIIQKLKTELGL